MSHTSKHVDNVLISLYRELSPEAQKMMREVFRTKKSDDEKETRTKRSPAKSAK